VKILFDLTRVAEKTVNSMKEESSP